MDLLLRLLEFKDTQIQKFFLVFKERMHGQLFWGRFLHFETGKKVVRRMCLVDLLIKGKLMAMKVQCWQMHGFLLEPM